MEISPFERRKQPHILTAHRLPNILPYTVILVVFDAICGEASIGLRLFYHSN